MSDKAMPLTIDEAIARLDAIGYEHDPETAHSDADDVLLAHVDPEVAEAYRRVINRQGSWWFA
jgi:hypothetical protein